MKGRNLNSYLRNQNIVPEDYSDERYDNALKNYRAKQIMDAEKYCDYKRVIFGEPSAVLTETLKKLGDLVVIDNFYPNGKMLSYLTLPII